MSFLSDLLAIADAERLATLERRLKGDNDSVDFKGSVAATWVKLAESGLGVVEYKGKKYSCIRQGSTSLFPGAIVKLTYANGVYFASW